METICAWNGKILKKKNQKTKGFFFTELGTFHVIDVPDTSTLAFRNMVQTQVKSSKKISAVTLHLFIPL